MARCRVRGERRVEAGGAVGHPEGTEDVIRDVLPVGLSGNLLHGDPEEHVVEVRVLVGSGRSVGAHRVQAARDLPGGERGRIPAGILAVGRREPAGVPEERPDRDGVHLLGRRREREPGQVATKRRVELEAPRLDELANGECRDRLAHRPDHDGGPGRHRGAVRSGLAERRGVDDRAVPRRSPPPGPGSPTPPSPTAGTRRSRPPCRRSPRRRSHAEREARPPAASPRPRPRRARASSDQPRAPLVGPSGRSPPWTGSRSGFPGRGSSAWWGRMGRGSRPHPGSCWG